MIYEHVKVSHEKDNFNKHLSNYKFYSANVDSSVKNQVPAVIWKQKKNFMLQVWKFAYVWLRYLDIWYMKIYKI